MRRRRGASDIEGTDSTVEGSLDWKSTKMSDEQNSPAPEEAPPATAEADEPTVDAPAEAEPAADEADAAAAEEAPAAEAEPEPQVNPDAEIVFVLGGPGSGKGTQCEQIVEKYGFKHYSAGDLLRAEVASGSEMGKELEEIMKEGKLVPSSVTIKLLKKAIATSDGMKFLIDGFPRALDQAEEFEKEVIPCKLVLFFDCPQDVMQERLLKRAETSGRADDNIETIKKRFDTFVNASMPVIEHFEKVDKVAKISAVPTPDEVFVEVCKVMDTQFASLAELEAAAIKLQSAGRGLLARKAARAKADGDGAADEAPAAEEAPKHEVQVLKIEGGAETIADYLAKHEIPAHLKVCLKKLDVTKGDAPYRFLASYFSMVADERGEPAL